MIRSMKTLLVVLVLSSLLIFVLVAWIPSDRDRTILDILADIGQFAGLLSFVLAFVNGYDGIKLADSQRKYYEKQIELATLQKDLMALQIRLARVEDELNKPIIYFVRGNVDEAHDGSAFDKRLTYTFQNGGKQPARDVKITTDRLITTDPNAIYSFKRVFQVTAELVSPGREFSNPFNFKKETEDDKNQERFLYRITIDYKDQADNQQKPIVTWVIYDALSNLAGLAPQELIPPAFSDSE